MNQEPLQQSNYEDEDGLPAGGVYASPGCTIAWQNGPLGRGDDRKAPNGAFVEDVIAAAKQRMEWYQEVGDGRFACEENAHAIMYLREALGALSERTDRREVAGTEGTHVGDG